MLSLLCSFLSFLPFCILSPILSFSVPFVISFHPFAFLSTFISLQLTSVHSKHRWNRFSS
jgi:hypothetical protein